MKRGPKPEPPSVKAARRTLQPIRDGLKTEIIVAGDPPIMPDYLTPGAILVWQEVLGRVMAAGVTEIDSALLARYCALEAIVRDAFKDVEAAPPPAAYLIRRSGFGISRGSTAISAPTLRIRAI
jgi:phage terminase small subunit